MGRPKKNLHGYEGLTYKQNKRQTYSGVKTSDSPWHFGNKQFQTKDDAITYIKELSNGL